MKCVHNFRKIQLHLDELFFYFPIELFYSVKILYYVEIKRSKEKARQK